jgi:hypothetical protein
MKTSTLAGVWRIIPIAAASLLTGGCSSALQSDQGKLAVGNRDVALVSHNRQPTVNEYASHCDEQARQRQHELANCTAVNLIDVQMEPKS